MRKKFGGSWASLALAGGAVLLGGRAAGADDEAPWKESDPGYEALDAVVRALPFKDVKTFDLPDETITRVTLLSDHLYIETLSKKVYAMERLTGVVRWVFETDTREPLDFPPTIGHGIPEERAKVEDDIVRVRAKIEDEKKAKTRDMVKLRELITRSQEYREKHKVILDRDNFYCLSKGWLFCLHRTGGQVWWKREVARLPLPILPSAQPFGTRSHVLLADVRLDRVYLLEVGTQAAPVHLPAGGEIRGQPVYEDPSVYFTSVDGSAYCYNVNGNLTWRVKTQGPIRAGAVIGKRTYADKAQGRETLEKTCYVGSTDYAFYAIDADTGALRWKYETGAPIETPAVAAGDTVYVKTEQGALFALDVKPMHKDEKGKIIGEKRNGELRWRIPLGERFVVKTPTRAFVLGAHRQLIGVEEMTGTIKSQNDLSLFPYILTNTEDSTLYLIHPSGHFYVCRESKTEF